MRMGVGNTPVPSSLPEMSLAMIYAAALFSSPNGLADMRALLVSR